jgi:hypothetical protein
MQDCARQEKTESGEQRGDIHTWTEGDILGWEPEKSECPEHPNQKMEVLMREIHAEAPPGKQITLFAVCPVDSTYWTYRLDAGWQAASDDEIELLRYKLGADLVPRTE